MRVRGRKAEDESEICIPQSRWGYVGNNLIADNYYTTQQPDTETQTCRETVSISYIIWRNTGATVTKSRMVWLPARSTEVISLITPSTTSLGNSHGVIFSNRDYQPPVPLKNRESKIFSNVGRAATSRARHALTSVAASPSAPPPSSSTPSCSLSSAQ